jgi:hypothetical protein
MVDALSRLPHQIKLVGIPNQTCDAHMFILQPKWLHNVYEYLIKRSDAKEVYYITKIVFTPKS